MTMNNKSFVMVADGGTTALADAFASQKRGGQRGMPGMGGMPNMAGMPSGGRPDMGAMPSGGMPDMGAAPADGKTAGEKTSFDGMVQTAKTKALELKDKLMAWLYEGVEVDTASTVTGSLVQVETGLKNDDYVEIISGLSEGDVILYTATEESSSSRFGMGMMGMGMGGRR